MKPVSSMVFSEVTEELLSPDKIHGWGYHHKLIAKKLKKQCSSYTNGPIMMDLQKHKKQRYSESPLPPQDLPTKVKKKHHPHRKHRRKREEGYGDDGDKQKHSKCKKRKRHTRKRYPVVMSPDSGSGSSNIPAYRVPPSIAVLWDHTWWSMKKVAISWMYL